MSGLLQNHIFKIEELRFAIQRYRQANVGIEELGCLILPNTPFPAGFWRNKEPEFRYPQNDGLNSPNSELQFRYSKIDGLYSLDSELQFRYLATGRRSFS
ncbi:hypothetical protein ACP26L_31805 [Paenibacillus sp. S-38]|uniref:hypothetical protein n=1 Tax=Paenibacillus sp. S-38 TaxID=3416710 RepID=UPI003CE9282D